MKALCAAVVGLCLMVVPVSIHAWGMDVHRMLTRRAMDGLPDDIRPFFAARRDFISEHAVDPDLWRVAAVKGDLGEEDPNHFLDIDGLDDPAPFRNVPHEWTAFVAKYGLERATKAGRLPWRAEEMYGRLVTAFKALGRTGSAYDADNARYLVAVLSHYVEDAHVPFHAVINYNGQLTNQTGIHSRFETDLVERNLSSLQLSPVAIRPLASMREFIFETVATSQSLVEPVLLADRLATAGRTAYDDGYYAAFWTGARPVLERRLGEAASAVASAVVSAYVEAGKPKLPLDFSRPPQPIRR
jgi:hypothetical protein